MLYSNCSELVARIEVDTKNMSSVISKIKEFNEKLKVGAIFKNKFYIINPDDIIKEARQYGIDYSETNFRIKKYDFLYFREKDSEGIDRFNAEKWEFEIGIGEDMEDLLELEVALILKETNKLVYNPDEIISACFQVHDSFGNEGLIVMTGDYEREMYPLISALEAYGEVYPHDGGHDDAYQDWINGDESEEEEND